VPPVLPDLPLGDAAKWLLVTVPAICFSLAAFAGPSLRARLGEERGLFVLVATLFVGTALRPFWGAWSLFAGTIVCGLAVAVMNVMMPSLLRRRFPRHLGEMTAAYTVALSFGSGLAAGLTIPISRAFGGSIRWALAVWAVPAAIALLVWLSQLRWARPVRQPGVIAIGLLRERLTWQITLYFGLQSMVWYTLLSWLPAIYRDRGTDPATAGALLGVLTAVGIVGNIAAPLAAMRLGDQRWVVLGASLLTTVALVGILTAPPQTALVWVILLGIGTSGSFSLALLLMASRNRDPIFAARLSSIAQGFGYVIAACGPLLAGFLHAATRGWVVPLLVTLGISAVQLVAGLGAARSRPAVGRLGSP
jgi:MFS transporter, CP family, cyanate transporter